jgi:DNA N-6-adenine-methyltransferase (Dam)
VSGFGGAHPHAPVEGRTDEWWTPPEVFEALGLKFNLDPCAPPAGEALWLPVKRRYTREDDGLSLPWRGRVWLNPPYGREAGKWVQRLAEHGHGIALVFSRTDVRWWHAAVPSATAICFIRGRLTFIAGAGQSAPGNSGGPSALVAYGDDCAKAIAESGLGLTYFSMAEVKG